MNDTPDRSLAASRLPARANLEHLKNEAKQRLKTMRSDNSAARLSEAQLLVARGYGFPSWRKNDFQERRLFQLDRKSLSEGTVEDRIAC